MTLESLLLGKGLYILFMIYAASFILAGKVADKKRLYSKTNGWLIVFFAPVMLIYFCVVPKSEVDKNETQSPLSLFALVVLLIVFMSIARFVPNLHELIGYKGTLPF